MLKRLVKTALRSQGFELHRYRVGSSEAARLIAMLDYHRVNLVIDVGANTGQFGHLLRDIGYRGRILSFEPITAAHKVLLDAAANDKHWQVAPRVALGAADGEIDVNIAANSESSSILPMLDAHRNAAPESIYTGVERVPLRRLDSFVTQYLNEASIPFLKIDAQGYEDQVLSGATIVLSRVVGLQLELSLTPLYAGTRLMADMLRSMDEAGFEPWGFVPAFVDRTNGRVLQLDGIFFRR